MRDAEGQVKTLRTLDAGSRTFGADLQYVFGKNVAKARRDNKRVIGTTDVSIAKRWNTCLPNRRGPERLREEKRHHCQALNRLVFLIVADPNGSGKSSAYQDAAIESFGRSVWIINPDLLAARIRDVEGLELTAANLEAVIRIAAWLETSVRAHQTVGIETVLSTGKYQRLVDAAKAIGFELWLIYVLLDSPERNVERVRLPVKKGGHAVPEDKIRERHAKSLEQMPWFLDHADRAWLYDNKGATPRLLGEKRGGLVTLDEEALPVVFEAVRKIQTE